MSRRYSVLELCWTHDSDGPSVLKEATPASAGISQEEFDALVEKQNSARNEIMLEGKKQLKGWFHRQTGKAKTVAGAGVFLI
ncbi:hypothetical protein VKT23_019881 [Stygiomarasmius scandens]|uniref:Uncharacterized protein n=1 Tax=Marasmiellus scandens TaxID=2682957 RepID=A0ABR1IN10_9AGAR